MGAMETVLKEIVARLKAGELLTERDVIRCVDLRNRELARRSKSTGESFEPLMKRRLLPFYKTLKRQRTEVWRTFEVDDELEGRLVELLRVKPRRSASGVATITVLTRPGPCAGQCLYCPQDVRMPKSYLADEPACRRAESLWFDPFLQVANRLRHLEMMGHPTGKVELIIAGGTWQDYPLAYRRWFVSELLRAVNRFAADGGFGDGLESLGHARAACYENAGVSRERDGRAQEVAVLQREVNSGTLSYNEAINRLYGPGSSWAVAWADQEADWDAVDAAWAANGVADCRVCGLAVETRPELIDEAALDELAHFGVTRVQLGLQSFDEKVLAGNGRIHPPETMARAFRLLRDRGFVIHGHYMLNLPGSTPELDRAGFRMLIDDARFRPDEVKLYPCVLVESAPLRRVVTQGVWQPYDEDTLIDLMAELLALAPPWLRISRIVRDISAHDVIAGAHRPNARQLVEARLAVSGRRAVELRTREVGNGAVVGVTWTLRTLTYETSSGHERFLAMEDDEGRVGAYARLTLRPGHPAMVRELRELGPEAAALPGPGPLAQRLLDRISQETT